MSRQLFAPMILAPILLAVLAGGQEGALIAAQHGEEGTAKRSFPAGGCGAEVTRLAGQKAVRVGAGTKIRPPRKIHDVHPAYPTDSRSRTVKGVWIGEALISTDGKVRHVWTLREIEFDPPWPEFNQAIVEAMKQWVYEPTRVGGRAVPVCMTVSTSFNWQ